MAKIYQSSDQHNIDQAVTGVLYNMSSQITLIIIGIDVICDDVLYNSPVST